MEFVLDIFNLETDLQVFCVTAKSFPAGIQEAHQVLHALIPFDSKRKYFGISYPGPNGTMIYKAAAEELEKGELNKHGLESYTIPKGKYLYLVVHNFMSNIPQIAQAFRQISQDPRCDLESIALEWYTQTDCRCMVKMK